jgi:hypothetical protein
MSLNAFVSDGYIDYLIRGGCLPEFKIVAHSKSKIVAGDYERGIIKYFVSCENKLINVTCNPIHNRILIQRKVRYKYLKLEYGYCNNVKLYVKKYQLDNNIPKKYRTQ